MRDKTWKRVREKLDTGEAYWKNSHMNRDICMAIFYYIKRSVQHIQIAQKKG